MKKMAISALLLSTCFASTAFAAESPTRSVGIGCTPAQNSDRETIHDRGLVKPSSAPEGSSGYRLQVKAAHTRNYMVTTANPLASAAGCRVLAEGGNAADAAVAVLAVLGLVEPQSSGIGGGAFALYFDARTGEISTYDGRDTVPAAATENYLRWINDADHREPLPDSRGSGRSFGTPGALRLLEMLHDDHGRQKWSGLFEPARTLATDGFAISQRLADSIMSAREALLRDDEATKLFFQEDNTPKKVGDVLRNPDYADTLEAVAANGPSAFYEGAIAEAIVDRVNAVKDRNGVELTAGKITLDDLRNYRAIKRDPALCTDYRAHVICGMPAPSSGGVAVAATLGILEAFDLGKFKPASVDENGGEPDPLAVHLVTEAERMAYADRDKYVADPDFVPLPKGGLKAMTAPDYLNSRSQKISLDKSMGVAEAGTFGADDHGTDAKPDHGTSHVNIVDSEGNAVSMTATINGGMGSYRVVRGFVLNNVLSGMSANPTDARGKPVANSVAPLKRPRSSMAPTLVFEKDEKGERGDLVLVTGSPGGQAIIQYVVKTALLQKISWYRKECW